MRGLPSLPPDGQASYTCPLTSSCSSPEAVLKNVDISVQGNILTIKVDLAKEFGPSSSGKTIIIASTEGNLQLPGRGEVVGLNVYRKK